MGAWAGCGSLSLLLLSYLLFCDSAFLVSHLCHTNKGTPSYKLKFAGTWFINIPSFIVIYYSNILVLLSLFSLRITDNWIKGKRNRQYIAPCFSSCGPWTRIIGIIWELVRTADPEDQSLHYISTKNLKTLWVFSTLFLCLFKKRLNVKTWSQLEETLQCHY